jgi:hypothetical protein
VTLTETDALAIIAVHGRLARAAHAADAGDGEAYGKCYTTDAVIEGHPRGRFEGRDAITKYYSERDLGGDPPHRHHIASIDAWFDEDGVLRSTNYFTVVGGGLIAGIDEHEFDFDGSEWLIKRKVTRLEFRVKP